MSKFQVGNKVTVPNYLFRGVMTIIAVNDENEYVLKDNYGSEWMARDEDIALVPLSNQINIILLDGTVVETEGARVTEGAPGTYTTVTSTLNKLFVYDANDTVVATFLLNNIAGWQYRESIAEKNHKFLVEESQKTPEQIIPKVAFGIEVDIDTIRNKKHD